jgi:DNA helicase IV
MTIQPNNMSKITDFHAQTFWWNILKIILAEELQCGLILTIYEAKGLEFDDILLYNFFKDSQVNIILLLIVAIVIVWESD